MHCSAGIEFTLSRNNYNLPGSGSSCGVLVCKKSNLGSGKDDSGTITNMTLFKTTTAGLDNIGGSSDGQLRRLASVSSTQPNLQQVYDGMKLYGVLKDGQATMRVELSKHKDCLSDYICELREVDAKGMQIFSSSRLVQQRDQGLFNAQDSSLTSSILIRLTSVIEQMDVKLAIMEDRTADLKKDLQRTEDKLCQLDSKLSAIDSTAIQEKVLKEMKTQIDNHFDKVSESSARTDDTLNKTATLVTTLNSNNKKFQSNMMDSYQSFFENVTRGMSEMFTRNQNQTDRMEANFISFKGEVDLSWQQLESSTNKSVLKTLSALQNITSKFNHALLSNMKSALTDFFMPEGCKKNTPVLLHPVSTPYPVIYRSEIPGLDTPILCDTITDGGGWIVIQRRSTGTVDFYRNWASYREGFGTLDNDFWLGNEKIHTITSSGDYELRVELEYQGEAKFALYDRFALAGEDNNYAITVGAYGGTAGDSLTYHNGHSFGTYDRDNDKNGANCAEKFTGAWWYGHRYCHISHLNGKWGNSNWKGLSWNSLTRDKSVSFSEMKIRRVTD